MKILMVIILSNSNDIKHDDNMWPVIKLLVMWNIESK